MLIYDEKIREILNNYLAELEGHFQADVIFYYGEIHPSVIKLFRDFIEKLRIEIQTPDSIQPTLTIILNTPGGSAETTEKLVEIIRHHYKEVYFIVPDYALSAGTIFCMSGNKIYMDYSSSLGPIDPQIYNEKKQFVPALGYLDKVKELIKKAEEGRLTQAEFLILQSMDLAFLSRCEQARELTVTLLKKWLVEHKFKNWTHHTSSGKEVTLQTKENRATEIAKLLGEHTKWHSHNRYIGIQTLQNDLKLKIEDYTDNLKLRKLIRSYNDLITQYIAKNNVPFFLHSKNHF